MSAVDRNDLRMLILGILYKEPQYTANQETILRRLDQFGVVASRAHVRTELAWLAGIDAVIDKACGGVAIATLTDSGAEHVEGRALIPDIRPPRPGEIVSG
jgi:hypothetical protein